MTDSKPTPTAETDYKPGQARFEIIGVAVKPLNSPFKCPAPYTGLAHLSIDEVDVDVVYFVSLIKQMPDLVSLELSHSSFILGGDANNGDISDIIWILSKRNKIKHLSFIFIYLTRRAIERLCDWVRAPNCSIRSLKMCFGVTMEVLDEAGKWQPSTDLAHKICVMEESNLMLAAMKTNTTITDMIYMLLEMTDHFEITVPEKAIDYYCEHFWALADMFIGNRSLVRCFIHTNCLRDVGLARLIFAGIGGSRSLQYVTTSFIGMRPHMQAGNIPFPNDVDKEDLHRCLAFSDTLVAMTNDFLTPEATSITTHETILRNRRLELFCEDKRLGVTLELIQELADGVIVSAGAPANRFTELLKVMLSARSALTSLADANGLPLELVSEIMLQLLGLNSPLSPGTTVRAVDTIGRVVMRFAIMSLTDESGTNSYLGSKSFDLFLADYSYVIGKTFMRLLAAHPHLLEKVTEDEMIRGTALRLWNWITAPVKTYGEDYFFTRLVIRLRAAKSMTLKEAEALIWLMKFETGCGEDWRAILREIEE